MSMAEHSQSAKRHKPAAKDERLFPFNKIDLHTHILPEILPDLKKRYGEGDYVRLDHYCACKARMYEGDKFFREVDENCYRAEPRLKDCDETGVTVQVLSTVPVMFNYDKNPDHCLDLSMMLNDQIMAICKRYPRRFVGLGTIPMQSPELAVQELERCMQMGMRGVQIGSHVNDWPLSEPRLFPVFQAAERLGAAVFVHPWDMSGSKLMEKYWLPWLVGMPAETSFAICSLIFGGVLGRLPNLKVAFAHGGGSFPQTIGRIEHGFKVRPDLCQIDNKINPRDFLGKFWVDSLVHDEATLQSLIKLMGPKKVTLGSDYPFPLGEVPTKYTPDTYPGGLIEHAAFLSDAEKADLLWRNGLELLGLKEEQFIEAAKEASVTEEEAGDECVQTPPGEESGRGKEEAGSELD